jgi:hypothetical protein
MVMQRRTRYNGSAYFRFGKLPVTADRRNLLFAEILKAPVPLPDEYDFDVGHRGVPTPMFANDRYGDCVIAGRAHQTLRFELAEQGKLIKITDVDVVREYMKETGGEDRGLSVLLSLKSWRREGWLAARRRYRIQAFAQIDPKEPPEVRRAVFMDIGVGLGLKLSPAAMDQFNAGKAWDIVSGPAGIPRIDMGHYVFVSGYTAAGPVCVTWGRKQAMTWRFLSRHGDEVYAIIDAVNTSKKRKQLNEAALRDYLSTI